MDRDLQRAKAALEERNAALEEELAQLQQGHGDTSAFQRESWAVCNATELSLLQRIASAVSDGDYSEMARLRDELDRRISAARAQEDVYVELCRDLLTDAERLHALSESLAAGEDAEGVDDDDEAADAGT